MKRYPTVDHASSHTNTDHHTDQQHPHTSAGHYDEIKKIEELRRRQHGQPREQAKNEPTLPKPASLPYLRRASHRR